MFAAIRSYQAPQASLDELEGRVREGFLPLIRRAPGFISYAFIRTGRDALETVSIFREAEQAEASMRLASDWIRRHASGLLPITPEVRAGEVIFSIFGPGAEQQPEAPSAPA